MMDPSDMAATDVPTLQLRRFPIEKMPDNATCVLAAESQGGKTTLGIDIMWHKRHLPAWYLFSESEGCSQRLSQTIPPLYTYPDFNMKKLEVIYNHQQQKIVKYSRPRTEAERRAVPDDELTLEERFYKNPCVGGYFEDCFGEKKIFNQKAVQNLFKNGRHRCMFSIIPCQYIVDLPISCRKQVKYWFLLREDSIEVRKKLFMHVGGACKDFKIFDRIMNMCTANYGCVVIDNISKSKNIEDRVFYYRAELHPAFKVGCKNFWNFAKKNYVGPTQMCNIEEEAARMRLEAARDAGKRGITKHHTVLPAVGGATAAAGQKNPLTLINTESMMAAAQPGRKHIEDYLQGKNTKTDHEPFRIQLL